jgi:hypothetical protein
MYFRRELDFDDLIETIDKLTDEQIDEVVDWQMTDSPAAKTEGIKSGRQAVEIGQRLANSAIQYGGQLAGIAAAGLADGLRPPSPPRDPPSRYEIPVPGHQRVVIPQLPDFINPVDRFAPLSAYRTIEIDIRTLDDPVRDLLRIAMDWYVSDGGPRRGITFALSRMVLMDARPGIELFREPDIVEGRDLVIRLGDRRVHAFLESR